MIASGRAARRRGSNTAAPPPGIRGLDHPHRHVRRGAQRRVVHLHATHRPARGLPGAGHRNRSHRGHASRNQSSWRATSHRATRGSTASALHPTPAWWKSTSTRPPTGTSWSNAPLICTSRHACRGSRARSSCSMAATPAPAAATTSCWEARRRPTRRSCAARTCCAVCSATGTTIRACRTCSRACSSAPHPRRRGRTKRAMTRSTSWSWPSRSCRPRARSVRRGWPTGSSATC